MSKKLTISNELGHWTGHESRLNRDLSNAHGSEGYAREELRAEIASMLLGAEIGIGHDGGQHASYVASWIKVLEENPKEIFDATRDAEKIQNFVLGLEKNINQEIDTDDLKRHFKEMTLGREVRAFEYKDGSDEWEALPEDLKRLIEEHNSLPEALQNDFFEKTISNPQMQTLISKGIEALEVCEENDLSL